MWPFKRREAESTEGAWDGAWVVGQTDTQEGPLIVRKNAAAAALVGNSRFSFRLGVAVPFRNPDANGMPGEEEFAALARIEDALVPQLQADHKALAVLTITTRGMREFVFYTRDPAWAADVVERLRAEFSTHELQSYIAPDAKWAAYEDFKL